MKKSRFRDVFENFPCIFLWTLTSEWSYCI